MLNFKNGKIYYKNEFSVAKINKKLSFNVYFVLIYNKCGIFFLFIFKIYAKKYYII
ncbi:hypothetical protein GCM10023210_09240 [Chryseobacterium ginsengisoli]|uniref:Uncharacterized protein n=1 Tax=Chryseobacterium ginsengisoli TaxID=363853 RepID=A0ABP9LWH3_9FLAO